MEFIQTTGLIGCSMCLISFFLWRQAVRIRAYREQRFHQLAAEIAAGKELAYEDYAEANFLQSELDASQYSRSRVCAAPEGEAMFAVMLFLIGVLFLVAFGAASFVRFGGTIFSIL